MAALPMNERWFQSRLSRPKANLTVLAGTDFANRIVAVFETAEEAKEAVDAHNARLNEKGPAEAATSPSRGSNNSAQETAVNEQHDTTAPALAATFDPFAHGDRLFRLKMLAGTASTLVNMALFEDATRLQGLVAITPHEAQQLAFIVDEVEDRAKEAAAAFDARVSQTTTPPTVVAAPISAAQDEAEEASAPVVPDPLSTMICELRALRAREVEIADRSPVVDAELRPARDAAMVVWRRLAHAAPVASTAAGAYLALEEALLDIDVGGGPLAPSLIRSALAYLGSAHVQ